MVSTPEIILAVAIGIIVIIGTIIPRLIIHRRPKKKKPKSKGDIAATVSIIISLIALALLTWGIIQVLTSG